MRFSFMILNLSLMDTLLKFMYDITAVRLVDIDAPIVPLFWGGKADDVRNGSREVVKMIPRNYNDRLRFKVKALKP